MEPISIREGSSKNVLIYKEPTVEASGEGAFEFTDYFSVFDWGRFLDDPIPGKGVSLAAVIKKNFELLNEAGIKNNYRGMAGAALMNVALVNVPKPYANVAPGTKNYLLPIEIIFRVYTHPASSDLKKIKEGKRTWQELGYEQMPEPNKRLSRAKMSYSTKLEETDRVLSREEARTLAGLDAGEMDKLETTALKVCDIITDHSAKFGLIHYDGKIEMAKDAAGDLMVVDVLGTLDEDRFMMDAGQGNFVDVSKQFIRDWYVAQGWKKQVDAAKKTAEEKNDIDWKKYCSSPSRLPQDLSQLLSEMYLAYALAMTGEDMGALGIKVRPLFQVALDMYEFQRSHKK